MKETKEVVKFIISLGHAIDKSLADKKIDVADLPHFLDAILKAPEAFKDINKVKEEWSIASFDQKQLFVKEIEQDLNLVSDKTEKLIEKSISIIVDLLEVIKNIKA